MTNITTLLEPHAADLSAAFTAGWSGRRDRNAWRLADEAQRAHGPQGGTRRLLTDPDSQHKLGMGSVPSYGLTLCTTTA